MAIASATAFLTAGLLPPSATAATSHGEPVTTPRRVTLDLRQRSVQLSDVLPGATFGAASPADTKVRDHGGLVVCGTPIGRGHRLGRLAEAVDLPGDTTGDEGQVSLVVDTAIYQTAAEAAAVLPALPAAAAGCGDLSEQPGPLGASREGAWFWTFGPNPVASWTAPPGVEVSAVSATASTLIGGSLQTVHPFRVPLDLIVLRSGRYIVSLQLSSRSIPSLLGLSGAPGLVDALAHRLQPSTRSATA